MLIAHSKASAQSSSFTIPWATQLTELTAAWVTLWEGAPNYETQRFHRATGTPAPPSLPRDLVSTLECEQTFPRLWWEQERALCVHCPECKQVYLNRGASALLSTCQHPLLRCPTCADCEIVIENCPLQSDRSGGVHFRLGRHGGDAEGGHVLLGGLLQKLGAVHTNNTNG